MAATATAAAGSSATSTPAAGTAPATSGGTPAAAPVVTARPPSDVIELQGQATFPVSPELGEYIKQHGSGGADIRVKFGNISKAGGTIRIASSDGSRFHTVPRVPSAIPIDHELFAGPLGEINPQLRIQIEDSQISGWAAPAAALDAAHALDRLIAEAGPALGLGGFDLSALRLQNAIEAGVFRFGTPRPVAVQLAGWVAMQLDLGLENDAVRLRATGDVNVRGLARGSLVIARDGKGVTGSAEMAAQLARFSGKVTATYASGALSIQGTLDYATEKLRGSLTVVVMEASEAEKAARAQIDPQHLAVQSAEATGEGAQPQRHGGAKSGRHGTGERGVAGWGELDFAFTDWLTGKAKAIIDPAGDITIIGKIAPPKSIELMAERAYSARLLDASITARYGLPYVADIHAGIGIQLGAIARLGPAVLTDIAVEGTYSTNPAAQTAFAITGALRISAYAGLNLRFEGKAGLTLLDHHVDLGAAVTGTAGVKGYAEARPTLGYREKADPAAGKKGEYVLQGHLELAAQPFLELGGELFVRLDSPWWSPAPDQTWTWPLFSLAYALSGEFGIAADVEHVIGSGQPPELHWGKAAFDAGKFTDSLLDRQIPEKRGGGDAQKPAAWKGAAAPASPAAPGAARAPGGAAKAPGTAEPKAGAGGAKAAKGGQTPDEARNVPKTPDASRRWLEGMKALAELHDRAEKDPETPAEIHQHLAAIKQRFGFTRLESRHQGGYWIITAALNPEASQPPVDQRSALMVKAAADTSAGPLETNAAPDRPDKPAPNLPNTFGTLEDGAALALYRGLHFGLDWDPVKYDQELRRDLVSKPQFALAAYEILQLPRDAESPDLSEAARIVQENLLEQLDTEKVRQWWGPEREVFDNVFYALLQRYVNQYGEFIEEISRITERGAYQNLKFFSIPFISTSKIATHSARYALGKKLNPEAAARIRRIGKGVVVGRVFSYVFTVGELRAQNAVNIKALRGTKPGEGNIKIRGYVLREGEVTFSGTIPGQNVIGQTDARGGESEQTVARRAEAVAAGSPAARGGLHKWDLE